MRLAEEEEVEHLVQLDDEGLGFLVQDEFELRDEIVGRRPRVDSLADELDQRQLLLAQELLHLLGDPRAKFPLHQIELVDVVPSDGEREDLRFAVGDLLRQRRHRGRRIWCVDGDDGAWAAWRRRRRFLDGGSQGPRRPVPFRFLLVVQREELSPRAAAPCPPVAACSPRPASEAEAPRATSLGVV